MYNLKSCICQKQSSILLYERNRHIEINLHFAIADRTSLSDTLQRNQATYLKAHQLHSSTHSAGVDSNRETMASTPQVWWSQDTVAVVTGANKGIGYEIVKQLASKGLTVVLTARNAGRGQAAIDALKKEGFTSVVFHPLEVSSKESVTKLASWLKQEYGGVDILINNAGVYFTDAISYENAKDTIDTNYFGTGLVTEGLLPVMKASPNGARVVIVTSRLGLYMRLGEDLKSKFKEEDKYSKEFADSFAKKYLEDVKSGKYSEEGWLSKTTDAPMYSESKIFLNAYALSLAKSLSKLQPADHQIFVTSFCPGVTQTEMFASAVAAGFEQPAAFSIKTVEDGADTGVWLALLPKDESAEKNGKLFGERTEYPFSLDGIF